MSRGLGALLVLAAAAAAAEVVWLDGRRERVERVVVKGDRLLLPGEKGMLSVAIRRVVQAVGDDAGVSVLVGMLSRTRHPAGADLPARVVVEEKIRACELLGRLEARAALEALRKAALAREPELAAAAQRAIDAIS